MKPLKITDLSVGDWVQGRTGTKAKILGIENWSDGYALNVRISEKDIGNVSLASAFCVPITPQILEQNGFKANEHSDKIYEYNEHNCLVQYFFVNNKLCIRNNNAIDVEIHSVHQLQHALRLAGVNKEIKL